MVSKKIIFILLISLIIVAVIASNCLNREIVYTCEDGTKVLHEDECPMIEIPVETKDTELEVTDKETEMETPAMVEKIVKKPTEDPMEAITGMPEEEVKEEPVEVVETVEGLYFNVTNVSFSERRITSFTYHAINNLDYEVDPWIEIYDIDMETQELTLLETLKSSNIDSGEEKIKEEEVSIRFEDEEDIFMLFKVHSPTSTGKKVVAEVSYMVDYTAKYGE